MKDLFEHYETLPKEVNDIIQSFDEMKDSYKECERLEKALKPLGYTFDWGLSGEPFNLIKIPTAVINYDTKELTLKIDGEEYLWYLNDGDVGDFWHTFTDNDNVPWDVNFFQEDETQEPSMSVYAVKQVFNTNEDNPRWEVDTNDSIEVIMNSIGNPKNYFEL